MVLRWFRHIRWRKPRTTFSYSYESNCQVRPTWTGSENDVPTHWKWDRNTHESENKILFLHYPWHYSLHHSCFKLWHLEHQMDFVHVLFLRCGVFLDVDGCFTSISSTRVVLQVPKKKTIARRIRWRCLLVSLPHRSISRPLVCKCHSRWGMRSFFFNGRFFGKQTVGPRYLGEEMWPLVQVMAFYWSMM